MSPLPPPANKSLNTVWHPQVISRADRERLNGHRSLLLWFTGFSGSGKSTLAQAVGEHLHRQGYRMFVLDGDNVRHGLCGDLGFSSQDRQENIRRIGEVAKLMVDAGLVVLAAFISPFRADRQRVRNLIAPGDFLEIHCNCTLEACEQRDTKGLYRKARAGLIQDFTGISSAYEPPLQPELALDTAVLGVEECVERIVALVERHAQMADGEGEDPRP